MIPHICTKYIQKNKDFTRKKTKEICTKQNERKSLTIQEGGVTQCRMGSTNTSRILRVLERYGALSCQDLEETAEETILFSQPPQCWPPGLHFITSIFFFSNSRSYL